ncbi:MAG: tetratricopeptide repeat protein [Planctomycetaceae bacterium]
MCERWMNVSVRCLFVLAAMVAILSVVAPQPVRAQGASAAQQPSAQKGQQAAQPKTPDPRVGKKFIVKVAGAELRTPKAIVWKAYLGETFTVALANGEWLWIHDKGGWLSQNQTIAFDTAIQETSAAIQKAPTAENFHLRGIAYVAHQDYDRAIADFTQSLKLEPGRPGVLNNRGQAFYLKGDYASAIKDLDGAVKADPKHFIALNNRALAHIAANQLPAAMNDLNAALTLHPEYPEALNNRGVVHSRQGNYKEAVADLTEAIKQYPDYVDALGNRSFAFRRLSEFPAAIADLKSAMEKAPLDYKPVNDLAWILATAPAPVQNAPEAVALAEKACQMTQYTNWNALDTLAAAHAAKGDFKVAGQWVTTALEKTPEAYKPRVQEHQQLILAGKPIPQ